MRATIEGTKINSKEELHESLATALGFPSYYGKNLDALWDCLTGQMEMPVTIVWKDYGRTMAVLGEYAIQVRRVLEEAACELDGLNVLFE
jgi:ribonuclease inhibitor